MRGTTTAGSSMGKGASGGGGMADPSSGSSNWMRVLSAIAWVGNSLSVMKRESRAGIRGRGAVPRVGALVLAVVIDEIGGGCEGMSGLLGDWGRRKTREGEAKVVGGGCEAAGPEVSDNWACSERARPSFSSFKGRETQR